VSGMVRVALVTRLACQVQEIAEYNGLVVAVVAILTVTLH